MDLAREYNKADIVAFLSSVSSNDGQQPVASLKVLAAASSSNTPSPSVDSIIPLSASVGKAHTYAQNGNVKGLQEEIQRDPNVVNQKEGPVREFIIIYIYIHIIFSHYCFNYYQYH